MKSILVVTLAIFWVAAGLAAEDEFTAWKICRGRPITPGNDRSGLVLLGPLVLLMAQMPRLPDCK